MKNEVTQNAAEIITSVSGKVAYGGAGSAILFGLTANDLAAIGGLVLGTIGLIVNIWFKYESLKVQRETINKDK